MLELGARDFPTRTLSAEAQAARRIRGLPI